MLRNNSRSASVKNTFCRSLPGARQIINCTSGANSARRFALRALQSSFHGVRRILGFFTYALHVSAEAVNRVASRGRAQKHYHKDGEDYSTHDSLQSARVFLTTEEHYLCQAGTKMGAAGSRASPGYWSKRKKLIVKASTGLPNGKNSLMLERRWYQEFTSTMIGKYPTTFHPLPCY